MIEIEAGEPTLSTYLLQKRVCERLDSEFEWSEIGRLIQSLHFLSHQRLVDRFPLGIGRVHYADKEGEGEREGTSM